MVISKFARKQAILTNYFALHHKNKNIKSLKFKELQNGRYLALIKLPITPKYTVVYALKNYPPNLYGRFTQFADRRICSSFF